LIPFKMRSQTVPRAEGLAPGESWAAPGLGFLEGLAISEHFGYTLGDLAEK